MKLQEDLEDKFEGNAENSAEYRLLSISRLSPKHPLGRKREAMLLIAETTHFRCMWPSFRKERLPQVCRSKIEKSSRDPRLQALAGSRLHFDKSRLTYLIFRDIHLADGLTCLPRFRKSPLGFATPNRKSRGINSAHRIRLGTDLQEFLITGRWKYIIRSYQLRLKKNENYNERLSLKTASNNEIFIRFLNTKITINFVQPAS